MFGEIKLPTTIEHDNLLIKIDSDKSSMNYHRNIDGRKTDKIISIKQKNSLIINPIEPTNTPEPISSHLLIDFDTSIVIEPQSNCSVFLTFPLEIGVFLENKKKHQMLDVFAFRPQKFTLYGEPTGGVICKYWPSAIHTTVPKVEPYMEGILELVIQNKSTDWHEITKAVFNAYHMKLFYQDDMVFMKGLMKILERDIAETSFEKKKPQETMKNCLEVYKLSKLKITSTSYTMESGL